MYKKFLGFTVLMIATVMLLVPQQGNTAESISKITDNKSFQVEITLPADGFKVGTNDLSLKVTDAKGKAVKGAAVSIAPWMPSMGHGVMLKPEIIEIGKGSYTAKNVGFSMPGEWQLVVTVSKKEVGDRATFEFANIGGGTAAKTQVACNCGTGGNCPTGCLCGCQAGITGPKCNMKDGKCLGNCACGCKEGKPCQMKDGKCVGGCGCGCQSAGTAASNCPCGTGGNCPVGCGCGCQKDKAAACSCGTGGNCPAGCLCGCQAGKSAVNCACGTGGNCPAGCGCGCQAGAAAGKCNMVDGKCQGNCSCGCKEGKPCKMEKGKCVGGCGCGCQSAGITKCKCGAGCTKLLNCNCGPDCKCPKDGKGGCGCKIGCATGCAKGGACPLPRPLGT